MAQNLWPHVVTDVENGLLLETVAGHQCGQTVHFTKCERFSETVQSLWKRVWQFFKTLNTELPPDPATLLLGIY